MFASSKSVVITSRRTTMDGLAIVIANHLFIYLFVCYAGSTGDWGDRKKDSLLPLPTAADLIFVLFACLFVCYDAAT